MGVEESGSPPTKGPPTSSDTTEGLEIEESGSTRSASPPTKGPPTSSDTTEGLEIEESGSTSYQVLKT
ncbi:hypothetical protein CEXT_361821 [Caerostris extrusa]|uniref:Uncharacterized protein n=1 Tax=Caerostris extrusa TaxID=172846 RepID=A0AAV4TWC1_CAEEX|nr:hypothetical protein CEXT_361821 [Caerostris extrusa]